MHKIIFLDIDGVLNSNKTFEETNGLRKSYNNVLKTKKGIDYLKTLIQETLLEIDFDKLILLKEITDKTGAK